MFDTVNGQHVLGSGSVFEVQLKLNPVFCPLQQTCHNDVLETLFEAGNATEVVLVLYVDRYCQYDNVTAVQDAALTLYKCC